MATLGISRWSERWSERWSGRWSGRVFFAGVLLFGLLAMTAHNAVDPDLWWHLRTGQWIVETGHVPHSDPFSFTRAGYPWVAQEWLSEVVFYELWKHGGAAALIVFSAIITTAGFMLLYLRCPGGRPWAAAATVLGALAFASGPSWSARPQMFTFTLASLLLWLLERGTERGTEKARPRLLFWIPPLFLLWLNLHAGFALGPALLLAYAVGLIASATRPGGRRVPSSCGCCCSCWLVWRWCLSIPAAPNSIVIRSILYARPRCDRSLSSGSRRIFMHGSIAHSCWSGYCF
jgi:hypothetical protein